MSKIESAVLGNASEDVEHEIVKEQPELSQLESHEVEMGEIEETFEENSMR